MKQASGKSKSFINLDDIRISSLVVKSHEPPLRMTLRLPHRLFMKGKAKLRTKTIIETQKTDQEIQEILTGFFLANGFKLVKWKGASVWKKGSGWISAPQFFVVNKSEESIVGESWISTAVLPWVFIGESGLDNQMAFAIKIPMRKLLKEIISLISMPGSAVKGYLPK